MDRSSAGIGSSKYIDLFSKIFPDVKYVTLEEGTGGIGPAKQRATPAETARSKVTLPEPASNSALPSSTALQKLRGKYVALTRYAVGFELSFWRRLSALEGEIQFLLARGDFKLVFARGAGTDFSPHFALVRSGSKVPWIAYYHDPYPVHLYPEPYRQPWSVPGWHAERWHRKVIRQASALAFPSRRLLEWVLCGDLAQYREKAFVLPHLATGIANNGDSSNSSSIEGFDQSQFNVVHTGTLLRHRSPWSLLEGCRRFTEGSDQKAKHTRLWQIGRVDRHLLADSRWAEYQRQPWFQRVESRVPYDQALRVLADSACGVVLEAVAAESPFFPAKLADHLMLRKPTLAITPASSTVRDILGSDYPLLCLPDSVDAVVTALELLWEKWRERALDRLAPTPEACAMASPETALSELQRMLRYLGISPP